MARFCPECGAQLEDNARFCAECGAQLTGEPAPAEAASQQPPAQEAPVSQENPAPEAPAWEAPAGTGGAAVPPQPPKVKKPLPKWALPTGIAVVAVVVILVAVSLILGSVNSPENVSEKFLNALQAGDFDAVSGVAVLADEEQTLTAEMMEPMFALYQESVPFRMELEELLDDDEELIDEGRDPNEGYLVDLRAKSGFLHTAYEVVLETCSTVEISSNLTCQVTLSGGQSLQLAADDMDAAYDESYSASADAYLAQWSSGTMYDVLPGLYTVSGTVTTSAGETFTAETQLTVDNEFDAYCELYFDYASVEVENDSDVPVDLYVNGGTTPFMTMEPDTYGTLAPLTVDATVEARADLGGDEPMTETFAAADEYIYLSFQLCDLEVYNDYYAPLLILDENGGLLGEVSAEDDYSTFEGFYPGTHVTIQMYDEQGLVDPYTVMIPYDDDYIYVEPEFDGLSDSAMADALTAITTYVDEVLGYYNAGDVDSLGAAMSTDFGGDLLYELESDQEDNGTGTAPEVIFVRDGDVTYYEDYRTDLGNYHGDDYDIPTAEFYCVIPLHGSMTADDGSVMEETDTVEYSFQVQYIDGAWTVTG